MENSTSSYITTVFSKLDLPAVLLEKLADTSDMETSKTVIPNIMETIGHNSTETYTTVNVEVIFMSNDLEDFAYSHIPVITPFLFTCTKGSNNICSIDWAASLS